MNERIKELAEQNGFIHKWQPPGEQYEKLQTLEKFAELIVRECIEVVKWTPSQFPNDECVKNIKDHFGVEE